MAYAKNVWYDNESGSTPITADKLNHIEQGVFDNAAAWDSVSPTRAGFLSDFTVAANSGVTKSVTFRSPMPSRDYALSFSKTKNDKYTLIDIVIASKTQNGFTVEIWNDSNQSTFVSFDWIAVEFSI